MLLAAPAAAQESNLPQNVLDAIKAEAGGQDDAAAGGGQLARMIRQLQVEGPAARGVQAQRDISYGPHPLQKLDVFNTNVQPGAAAKPIVIFLHGGGMTGGSKHSVGGLDNIMTWVVNNGFVGINMNYRLAPEVHWPAGIQDIDLAIQWARLNATRHGGDPDKIFLWGQSAGGNHIADYISHPNMHATPGPAVRGAILFSAGRTFDLATYEDGGGAYYENDASKYAERSSLPGLKTTRVPLFMTSGEYDMPNIAERNDMAVKALCAAGRCPEVWLKSKGHNHGSPASTINTVERQLSDPVLAFLKRYSQ
jgi:triacylglycerol lipase